MQYEKSKRNNYTADFKREAVELVLSSGRNVPQIAASLPLTAVERGVPYIVINRGATDHDPHPGLTLRLNGDVQDLFPPAVMAALD